MIQWKINLRFFYGETIEFIGNDHPAKLKKLTISNNPEFTHHDFIYLSNRTNKWSFYYYYLPTSHNWFKFNCIFIYLEKTI